MGKFIRSILLAQRRTIVFGLTAWMLVGGGIAGAARPPRVLFVCQSGTAKSAIAREFLRRRAAQRGIAVTTFSRGIVLENHVSPLLQAALTAERIDTTRDGDHVLTSRDVGAADIIIFFNALPPKLRINGARDWSALPSVNDNWPEARIDLIRRIDALLDDVARSAKHAR
jgi:hypothetical protein